jgi:hypothetical protein
MTIVDGRPQNWPSTVSQWLAYLYDRALLHPGGR